MGGDPTRLRRLVGGLPSVVGVGEAVGVVRARAHVDLRGVAHQVVVVDALGALACADVRQHLGQAAVDAGLDESGAGCMVLASANSDGVRGAAFVVVE